MSKTNMVGDVLPELEVVTAISLCPGNVVFGWQDSENEALWELVREPFVVEHDPKPFGRQQLDLGKRVIGRHLLVLVERESL